MSSQTNAAVFRVERLPLLARLHELGFRGSRKPAPALVKCVARVGFYLLRRFRRGPVLGRMQVDVDGAARAANFDARNRQFAAVYFERYAGGYEPEVAALIAACVGQRGVLYDVGSNWGYFSVLAAARAGFRGAVHAFEPWPASFRDLRSIVEQLGLSPPITCHNLALGESSHRAAMTAGSHSGLAHIARGKGETAVAVRALDELVLDPPSLIKIDTEGHEAQVLRGATRLLAAHRPMVIFEHRHENEQQWRSAGVFDVLAEQGYRLFVPRLDGSGLELLEINAASRAGHARDANLFACHASRMGEMAQMMEPLRRAA